MHLAALRRDPSGKPEVVVIVAIILRGLGTNRNARIKGVVVAFVLCEDLDIDINTGRTVETASCH